MTTRAMLLVLLTSILLGSGTAQGGPADAPWAGEWRTSFSTLKLAQDGAQVTGTYGNQDQFQVEGTVAGDTCSFTYTEGAVVGKGEWVMQAGAHAFKGKLIMANGRPRDWHGWRPDPAAQKGTGKYKGTWLTSLGLMHLTQKAAKVKGTFGWRGGSVIEGELTGRRLDFRYQILRGGGGWFEIDKDNKTFRGAGNDAGSSGWWGWEGRAAPEYEHHAKLKAGKIVGGATDAMLSYRIRAPENYKPGGTKKWPCILIFHGMNMNAEAYVNTLAVTWKDLAKEYLILGINGERPSSIGKPRPKGGPDPDGSIPSFNYTYVNWMGKSTYKGYPGTERESPGLLSQAMEELRAVYPIGKYFVGGHSQGGYLTYVMLMHYPELIAGAFPIAGGLIMQAEPDVFDKEDLKAQQRDTPLCIVHSRTDPNVNWSASQYAAERFMEEGWRAFHFLAPERGGHMFGLLPVGDAIRWLAAMASEDAAALRAFAEARMGEKAWADACSALRRAEKLEGGSISTKTKALLAQIDAVAQADAANFEQLITENKDGSWIEAFLTFRDQFQHAPCAQKAMQAFAALRAQHTGPANEANQSARQAFNRRDQDAGYAKYQEIVDQYYAAPRYRMTQRWIRERK